MGSDSDKEHSSMKPRWVMIVIKIIPVWDQEVVMEVNNIQVLDQDVSDGVVKPLCKVRERSDYFCMQSGGKFYQTIWFL